MANDTNNKPVKRKIKLGRFVLSLVIIIYAIFFMYTFLGHSLKTAVVNFGIIENTENVEGYIIRSESVVTPKTTGVIRPIKLEGERVPVNSKVATVYSESIDNIQKNIDDLNQKIQEATKNRSDFFSNDIQVIDDETANLLNAINTYSSGDNYQKMIECKDDINELLVKKSRIAGDLSPAGSYIKNYVDDRNLYERKLQELKSDITTQKAGIVSYKIDGFENVLTKDVLPRLTSEKLTDLKIGLGEVSPTTNGNFKIIDNFECFIAVIMNSEKAKTMNVDDRLNLRFPQIDNELIPASIEYIYNENKSHTIICFRITKDIEKLISYRKINFDVVWENYSGLKIPESALIKDGENYKIQTVEGDYTLYKPIKLVGKNKDFAIVESLDDEKTPVNIYDEVVIKPTNISEGTQVTSFN